MSIYDFNKEKQDYTQAFYELMLSVLSSSGGNLDLSAPRLTLIGTTKLKIDELQPQQEGVQFIDASSDDISNVLDLYINGLLDECAKHIHQTAPLHIIIPTDGSSVSPVVNGTIGHVVIPDDYLRFVSFKMSAWLQEVTSPILTTSKKYKHQKYLATRASIAKPVVALNTIKVTNTPVSQVDTVTLSGTSGTANLSCAGVVRQLTFNTSLTQTATDFVTNFAADYATVGVVVTSSGADLIFTASVAGTPFTSPWVSVLTGDLSGTTVNTTPNVPGVEAKRTIEYYSVPAPGSHTLSKFLYVSQVGAEYVQDNLTDALTWLCASKVLQVMGDITNQGGYAEKALEQVELSYKNLM
jgi:hypothetical protein